MTFVKSFFKILLDLEISYFISLDQVRKSVGRNWFCGKQSLKKIFLVVKNLTSCPLRDLYIQVYAAFGDEKIAFYLHVREITLSIYLPKWNT